VITLDANVLIALADEKDASHQRAFDLIDEHEWEEFATTAIALSEVLVRPHRRGRTATVSAMLNTLGVRVSSIGVDDAPGVAAIRADSGMRAPDASVLHTAMVTGEALATFDERLARVARTVGLPVVTEASAELPDWAPPSRSAE
jgi:predicted nucleic acid-binding protein